MSNSLTDEIRSILDPAVEARIVLTAGNTFRSDDGIGPWIAEQLIVAGNTDVVDAGQNPENVIDDVIERKPKRLILIDAADFGGDVGEVRLIPEELIPETTLSTHMIPLNVVTRIIGDATGCETFFLGIQAVSFDLGEGICEPVLQAGHELVGLLNSGN